MRRPKDPEAYEAAHPLGRAAAVIDVEKYRNERARPLPGQVTSLDEWAAKAPKKKKGLRSAARQDVASSIAEADQMRAASDFTAARPRHFVGLYALFHNHVYGVAPSELSGKTWTAACLMAARILDREFGKDIDRFVSFIAWTWRREKRAHVRASGERRRLGWRLQFSPTLVTDYRVELARERERAG